RSRSSIAIVPRTATRSAPRSRAISAAALGTRRSSTPSATTPGRSTRRMARTPSDFALIGRPVIRHDARDKVVAATAYAGDWTMAGMLHAVVVRSPYASARILRIDTTRALKMPGVVAVLTARDVPRNTLMTDVPGQTTTVGALRARLHVLAEDR